MPYTAEDLALVLRLIEENGTLHQVSDFLKSRDLTYSASSWEQMITERLRPAVDDGELTFDDLLSLLNDLEEFGRQHVFLYECEPDRAAEIAEEEVWSRARRVGLESLREEPRVLDKPEIPTVTDIRTEFDGTLVIKYVELRRYKRKLGEREPEAGRLIVEYQIEEARAINVFVLHPTGMLELRIYRHKNRTNYEGEVAKAWEAVDDLLDRSDFDPVAVTRAKNTMWEDRHALAGEISFADSSLKGRTGTVLRASAATPEVNLDEDSVAESLDDYYGSGAYCERQNVYWLPQEDGTPPNRKVRVLLSGALNEIAITTGCSREDYEHVFRRIIELNG